MLLCHEGSLQAYWLDGRRSDPLAMQPSQCAFSARAAEGQKADGAFPRLVIKDGKVETFRSRDFT